MPDSRRPFDPLAALFHDLEGVDVPVEALASANDPEATDTLEHAAPPADDLPGVARRIQDARARQAAGAPPEDKAALARRLAQEAMARAQAAPAPSAPAPPAPAQEDKAALARRLAQEAMARAQAAQVLPAPAQEDKAALARRLAQEAMARTQAAQAPPSPAPEDKAALARRLAQEAAAKARRPEPAPEKPLAQRVARRPMSAAEALERARLEEAQREAEQAATRPTPGAPAPSRGAVAPAPPAGEDTQGVRRHVSASEAARRAIAAEQARDASRAAAREVQVAEGVRRLVARELPGVSVAVGNAMKMEDREVLSALWRGHRAREAAAGDLQAVAACSHVLQALDTVPAGLLHAARVQAGGERPTEYLVWVDADAGRVLAAFPEARQWFVRWQARTETAPTGR